MSGDNDKSTLPGGVGGGADAGSSLPSRGVSNAGLGGPALQVLRDSAQHGWETKWGTGLRPVNKRRTLVALLLAAVLVVPTGLYRQRGEGGLPAFQYDALRRNWLHRADVVLAGDSRVQRGLCPAVMTPALRAQRVLNFAYPNSALVPRYLARVESVLDPHGAGRAVVLGVTPHSLTSRSVRISEFLAERERPAPRLALEPIEWLFEPYSLDVLSRELCGQTRRGESYLAADGWRGATAHVIDPEQESDRLRDLFDRGQACPVSAEIIDGLVAQVARWSRKGIRVYAFRPPTTPKTVALEDKLYHFDQGRFVSRFEAAGGVWIDVDPAAYATYDGNHLQGPAAVRLSADLGEIIHGLEMRSAAGAVGRRPPSERPGPNAGT